MATLNLGLYLWSLDVVHIVADWNSALFIILNGTKQEHLNMLDGGIIQRLLEEKWKTFARVRDVAVCQHLPTPTDYDIIMLQNFASSRISF